MTESVIDFPLFLKRYKHYLLILLKGASFFASEKFSRVSFPKVPTMSFYLLRIRCKTLKMIRLENNPVLTILSACNGSGQISTNTYYLIWENSPTYFPKNASKTFNQCKTCFAAIIFSVPSNKLKL